MKICIIPNGYPDKRDPQYGCFEKDQALALKSIGHEVSILYVDSRLRWWWRKIGFTHKSIDGLEIYSIFVFPFNIFAILPFCGSLIYRIKTVLMQNLFSRLVKDQGMPNVLYAHYMTNIAYGVYLKKKNGIPLVGIEHWSMLTKDSLSDSIIRKGRLAYDNCDKLLSVSESLKLQIKKHFGNDSLVVPDMIGREFVREVSMEGNVSLDNLNGIFNYLAIGSLIPRKGFDLLLEAFAKAKLKEMSCKVLIIGGGQEYENLQNQARSLGITEAVRLMGRKNKEEIINIMRASHVFVLSSRAETFGVVCIEALSQGLPNIATICGGPEEILTKEDGILIPIEDTDALAEAMKEIYYNYSKYDKKNISDRCKKKYAPNVIAAELTTIFEETIYNLKS